jgi:hypothetical protein
VAKGQRGGARPGAGRPPSMLTKTSRDDAVAATKEVGRTPIQVMARNMAFWDDAAESLTGKIISILEAVEDGVAAADEKLLNDINTNIKKMLIARDQSQRCAEGMAPYRHPRLANIEVHAGFSDEPDSDLLKIAHKTTPQEAAKLYEDVLHR